MRGVYLCLELLVFKVVCLEEPSVVHLQVLSVLELATSVRHLLLLALFLRLTNVCLDPFVKVLLRW